MNEPKTNEKKRGWPINPYRAAERIIGTAGVTALSEADLYIVDGDTIRKLAGMVEECFTFFDAARQPKAQKSEAAT